MPTISFDATRRAILLGVTAFAVDGRPAELTVLVDTGAGRTGFRPLNYHLPMVFWVLMFCQGSDFSSITSVDYSLQSLSMAFGIRQSFSGKWQKQCDETGC
jgi:hypothetical protein